MKAFFLFFTTLAFAKMHLYLQDFLGDNLKGMQKFLPRQYAFFPKTFCLPREYQELCDEMDRVAGKKSRTFIGV